MDKTQAPVHLARYVSPGKDDKGQPLPMVLASYRNVIYKAEWAALQEVGLPKGWVAFCYAPGEDIYNSAAVKFAFDLPIVLSWDGYAAQWEDDFEVQDHARWQRYEAALAAAEARQQTILVRTR